MINKVFLQIDDCYVHAVERGEHELPPVVIRWAL